MTNPNPNHSLFQSHPLRGAATISTGAVTVPYHIYDGYGALIGGTADLAKVRQLLSGEELLPVQNRNGRALMGIWLCDFTAANLGPHHELQISFFVSRQPLALIANHRLGLLAALLMRPEMQMLCHGLWNNTPQVVAYNRELLSLNARLSQSTIQRNDAALECSVSDATTGASLVKATLANPNRPSLAASLALMGQLGLGRTIRISRQPWVEMQIVNPRGVKLVHNGTAHAYTSNASNLVHFFDLSHDHLQLDAAPYATLDFRPEFVQHMAGFKFVYEEPS